jgi:hypothetical protein
MAKGKRSWSFGWIRESRTALGLGFQACRRWRNVLFLQSQLVVERSGRHKY